MRCELSITVNGRLVCGTAFRRGECVEVDNLRGEVIAKGITNYSSSDMQKIKGMKSGDIEKKLGYKYAEEVIHRDNMVII